MGANKAKFVLLRPTKLDFISKRFHPSKMDVSRPQGRISIKKAPTVSVLFYGAGDEARTRYLDLGKVALYQMSYARKRKIYFTVNLCVCQALFSNFRRILSKFRR